MTRVPPKKLWKKINQYYPLSLDGGVLGDSYFFIVISILSECFTINMYYFYSHKEAIKLFLISLKSPKQNQNLKRIV